MKLIYEKQDEINTKRGHKTSFLLTNGLGGYASQTAAYAALRSDAGILVAAVKAPNERISMVHRLKEQITVNGQQHFLSSQLFADKKEAEDGYTYLSHFSWEYAPCWQYEIESVRIKRQIMMKREKNTTAILYRIENRSEHTCELTITPLFKFAPKEEAVEDKKTVIYKDVAAKENAVTCAEGKVNCEDYELFVSTDGKLQQTQPAWELLAYPEDAKDGRPNSGYAASCCEIGAEVKAGETKEFQLVFSMKQEKISAHNLIEAQKERCKKSEEQSGFTTPIAKALVTAADSYIVQRESTGGKTIIAGYPLFADWGRDTMIALPGCCLATGRYEDAKNILKTFLVYEKDGLMPNLFPEGEAKPMYNTVDAALLFINCVWLYFQRTKDAAFVREAYPVMERIIKAYRKGTRHGIFMDEDGLISAGEGLDQVTWMDVCINGILPTPRHGKPVEINAYWYNALCIMNEFTKLLGKQKGDYEALAKKVKVSFTEQFYLKEKGYLKDVLSGTDADEQLRCNQIWAVTLPFTMLTKEQEKKVTDTVSRYLYTPCGLRTLSPEDEQYHGTYGGSQEKRDMAYHQGTTWVFPMGAYYRACLKIGGRTPEAAKAVLEQMKNLLPMLREGCAGQLPEIYDGDSPKEGKGCFGQAWSVGEMLLALEEAENILTEQEAENALR